MAKGRGGFISQDGLNAPNSPTGVSATAGDTEATVSWNNPTNVGGSAITNYHIQSNNGDGSIVYPSYTLNGASYDNIDSAALSSQIGQGQGLFFKSDGLKMYASDQSNAYQYSLSTAWDLSTISYDSKSLSLSSASDPNNIFFKSDGTKFYVVSKNDSYILEFDVSTAWDISTGSSGYSRRYLVSSQMSNPTGIFFKPDGTKMYVLSNNDDTVYQYSLSTAWNVTTASYDSKSFSVSSQEANPRPILLSSDGTKMFVTGTGSTEIEQYGLSTAYDISSASYSNLSLDISSEASFPYSMAFKSDGKKLYVFGATTDKIHQYSTGLSVGDLLTSPITLSGLTNGTSYTFNVWAINAFGWSAPSDASDAVSPAAPLGVFARGYTGSYTNTIDYVTMSSAGNATDWGDATSANGNGSGTANATRGLFASSQAIDYITFSSTGNAADFGDMPSTDNSARCPTSGSNSTRGLLTRENATTYNQLQYVTFATTGNATNFGDLSVTRINTAGFSSPTRAVYAGGSSDGGSSYINNIDYVTTATTGNATDFGDQTEARGENGGASSSTRGLVLGGKKNGSYPTYWSNVIDYVTIASTGNATDFGDLTQSASGQAGASSNVKAIRAGGEGSAGTFNNIDEVTIATTGNATDFGDLTLGRYNIDGGLSNAHGGLS